MVERSGRHGNGLVDGLFAVKRWMYRGNRPGRLARAMNWLAAAQHRTGILAPRRAVTLELTGRRSGRPVWVPLVLVEHEGGRYLVSMLGEDVNWVHNVRAAGGRAVLCRRGREPVLLTEVEPARRAPILRRYLELAPGARPHVPVSRRAPVAEFEEVAGQYPVFAVTADPRLSRPR